jgi:hypothetical protein
MEKLAKETENWIHFKEINLRWIVAEAIHSTNNFLGGISYATYFLREDAGQSLDENLQMINQRVEGAAEILNSLFVLVSPLEEGRTEVGLKDVLEKVRSLFSQKVKATKSEIRIEVEHGLRIGVEEGLVICQVVYTWLWQRFSVVTEPVYMEFTSQREEQAEWLRITDDGPGLEFADWPEGAPVDREKVGGGDRNEFALKSLKHFDKYLKMRWSERTDNGVEFCLRISPVKKSIS